MNTLSWLIYLADLSGSLSWGFGFFAFLTVFFTAGFVIARLCALDDVRNSVRRGLEYNSNEFWKIDDPEARDQLRSDATQAAKDILAAATAKMEAAYAKMFKTVMTGVVFFVVFVLLALALPDRETVLGIAASEMGETALNTETGGKAVLALNAWLDRQINGEPTPEETKTDTK